MIELRCEIVNCTKKNIWVYESVRDIPDPNGVRTATVGVFADEDDRRLILDGRMGTLYGSETWCNVGGAYTRLAAGQSSPAVLRTFLTTIPWYATVAPGFYRMRKRGIDHLSGISFEIGYFTEEDLSLLRSGPDTIHQLSKDKAGDRIGVFDSSQGEACRAERIARVVVEGIYLPYKEWLAEGPPPDWREHGPERPDG